jgi:hypothetical protein
MASELYTHQQKAVDAALANQTTLIEQACGTGKSRVIVTLVDEAVCLGTLTVVVVPSLALAAQVSTQLEGLGDVLKIDSDTDGTTDPGRIAENVTQAKIVLCTYHSKARKDGALPVQDKAEALADYLEHEGKAPPQKLMTEDDFKLGKFWNKLVSKHKRHKPAVEAVLARRPAARAVYERELEKYEAKKDGALPVQDKAEALADYLEREGKRPPTRLVTEDGFRLGPFWNALVGPRKDHKAAVEAVLARRPAARAVYERVMCERDAKKDGTISAQDKAEALAAYLEHESKAPPTGTVTDDGFTIGTFWKSLVGKQKCNKGAVEAVLARRPAARAVYERELYERQARVGGKISAQDKAEALADYLEREGERPPYKTVTEDGFKLGWFWDRLVGPREQNKAAVEAVLARRPAARAVYERALRKRKERKDRETTKAADGARAAKRPRV